MSKGGKREGAGRPRVVGKREQVSLSVSPETKERLRLIRQTGTPVGQVIDELVRKFCEERNL